MPIIKPVTHLTILYADRSGRRRSPAVPSAAIAIFTDSRDQLIKYKNFLRAVPSV